MTKPLHIAHGKTPIPPMAGDRLTMGASPYESNATNKSVT